MSVLEQTPVPLLQREDEFDALLDLYRERKPKWVLEVGTYHGGTLYHWLRNAQPGTTVVSLDSYRTDVDNRSLYEGWTPEGVDLAVLEGDSRAESTIERIRELAPYDWVFIDAGHLYDEVKADWLNYGPMCNGVVCFHDILYPDVARLWDEIKSEYSTREIISDPIIEWPGWCGIGCVFM